MSLNNPELYSLFLPLCPLAMVVTVCSRGSIPAFRVGSEFEEEEEGDMDLHVRKNRETSPDRVKVYMQPKMKQYRKVQVLYYLCRNGQLEHPHFMEVCHLATQQLRLKDVMDRLTVLRGKGMPSLFSWSCKRSYKNGYVWNDLAENDVIYPAEGAEYVLKGSELIEGSSDRFQQLQINSNKRTSKPLLGSSSYAANYNLMKPNQSVVDVDEDMGSSSSGTPKRVEILDSSNRCSRGVSTEEQQNDEIVKNSNPSSTEISLNDGSPPSSSSTVSEKNSDSQSSQQVLEMLPDIRRFKPINRNPFLLQLMACGSMATKGREQSPVFKNIEITKKSLHKSVVCKIAAKAAEEEELDFISENPRFGNLQSEEKEYFSGSIVETTSVNQVSGDPTLKKSNSYNEERGQRSAMAEALAVGSDCSRKGKCIPRRRSSKQLRK